MKSKLVVLAGPSGVGKGTVVRELVRQKPQVFLSVSATTRKPRPEEKHDDHYVFLSDKEFKNEATNGNLLEYAEFAGAWYGTPRKPVEDRLNKNQVVILEIDLQGARQVKESMPDAFMIFLKPPSIDELKRRLIERGTEKPEELELRLKVATSEIEAENEFDAVVINEDVQSAVEQLIRLLNLT
ncbi:MAG: guanylate kinase [Candidatus Nanopelagicales bacterium]|nr:guanylate kinase [Actinomycetota bacterium]MDP4986177.1 guanylate kinase [Candidatus Nanopelagicales bacterium]